MYDDALIISQQCPVFRDDDGQLLPQPYDVTFITCAATNLSAMRQGLAKSSKPLQQPDGKQQAASTQHDRSEGENEHQDSRKQQQRNMDSASTGSSSKLEEITAAAQAALLLRGRRVLAAAAVAGCTHVVLGAWGCGVFGHDQHFVASMWKQLLQEPEFEGVFQEVEFAILDGSQVFETVLLDQDTCKASN